MIDKRTLVRGESLSINVELKYLDVEAIDDPVENMVADAWFQNNKRVPLTITKLNEAGCYNLYSDIDTNKLIGDSFLVNIVIKDRSADAPEALNIASFNHTFYILNSATEMPAKYYIIRFFDYDGTLISTQRAREHEKIIIPPSPSRSGYTFNQWTPSLEMKAVRSIDYTATYTLNAEVIAGHSVVYRLNGEVYSCQNYSEGTPIIPPVIEVEGYNFNGWKNLPSVMPPDTCVVSDADITPIINYSENLAYLDLNETECCVIGRGTCTDWNIAIPPYHNGKKVIGIGVWSSKQHIQDSYGYYDNFKDKTPFDYGFAYDSFIEKLIVPETVKYIGRMAFSNCVNLRELIFLNRENNSELRLCGNCFSNCSLINVTVPGFVTADYRDDGDTYGYTASEFFFNNQNLKSIVFEEGFNLPDNYGGGSSSVNMVFGESMLANCINLENVYLPSTLQNFVGRFFENCHKLSNIVFKARTIKSFGSYNFASCGSYNRKLNLTFEGNAPLNFRQDTSFYDNFSAYEDGRYVGTEVTINYHGQKSGWTAFRNTNWNTVYAVLKWNDLDSEQGG